MSVVRNLLDGLFPDWGWTAFTLLLLFLATGVLALGSLLIVAPLLWAIGRLHPLLSRKLWAPAVKSFADLSERSSIRGMIAVYFACWFAFYIWWALDTLQPGVVPELWTYILYAAPYIFALAVLVWCANHWNDWKLAAQRRSLKAVLFAMRVVELLRFFLLGWMNTKWGVRIVTILAAIMWLSGINQMAGNQNAAWMTAVCFVAATLAGTGLSKLMSALRACASQRRLNAIKMWLSFALIPLIFGIESLAIYATNRAAGDHGIVMASAVAILILITLAAPFCLGWKLHAQWEGEPAPASSAAPGPDA